jgi:vacuolar-type H+-ATPase subunit C/Vma6
MTPEQYKKLLEAEDAHIRGTEDKTIDYGQEVDEVSRKHHERRGEGRPSEEHQAKS